MEYILQARFATKLQSSPTPPDMSRYPPPQTSPEYSQRLADLATRILYCSPLSSHKGLPLFVLNAAAFPDANEVDYNKLLPYILARLPADEELIGGNGYEIIFFAGGDSGITGSRKTRPGWGWFFQAYHLLTRAARKRLQTFIIVHESSFIRILVEMFSTIISPKFRKKIVHASTLTVLAQYLPIEDVLVPPSAYVHDRKISPSIQAPYATGRRAFGVRRSYSFVISQSGEYRLPRVLRETTVFLTLQENIQKEGLFRISASNQVVHILAEAYDRGQKFIVWKDENVYLPFQDTLGRRFDPFFVEEADLDGYGVHTAAALIKLWYRELHRPLIPLDSYGEIQRLWSAEEPSREPTIDELSTLLSTSSLNTTLPLNSRLIITSHLIPLLSAVAKYAEKNRMTAGNLAVCFAPTLTRGDDPMQEVRIANTVTKLLTICITLWDQGLRQACGQNPEQFRKLLSPPLNGDFYEDPLDQPRADAEPVLTHNDQADQQGAIWEAYSPLARSPPHFQPSNTVVRKQLPSEDSFAPPRPSPTIDRGPAAIKRKPVSTGVVNPLDTEEPPSEATVPALEEPKPEIAREEPVISNPEITATTQVNIDDRAEPKLVVDSSLVPVRRKHVTAKSFGGATGLKPPTHKHNAARSYDGTADERELQQAAAAFEGFYRVQQPPLETTDISRAESGNDQSFHTGPAIEPTQAALFLEGQLPEVTEAQKAAPEPVLEPVKTKELSIEPPPASSFAQPEPSDVSQQDHVQKVMLTTGPAQLEPVAAPQDMSTVIQSELDQFETPNLPSQEQPASEYVATHAELAEGSLLSSVVGQSVLPSGSNLTPIGDEPLGQSLSPATSPLLHGSGGFQQSSPVIGSSERPSSVASDSSARNELFSMFGAGSPGTRSPAPQSHLLRKAVPQAGQSPLYGPLSKTDAQDILSLSRTIKPQAPSLNPVVPKDATSVDILDSPVLIRRGTTKLSGTNASREPRKINMASRDLGDLKRVYEERAISARMIAEASKHANAK